MWPFLASGGFRVAVAADPAVVFVEEADAAEGGGAFGIGLCPGFAGIGGGEEEALSPAGPAVVGVEKEEAADGEFAGDAVGQRGGFPNAKIGGGGGLRSDGGLGVGGGGDCEGGTAVGRGRMAGPFVKCFRGGFGRWGFVVDQFGDGGEVVDDAGVFVAAAVEEALHGEVAQAGGDPEGFGGGLGFGEGQEGVGEAVAAVVGVDEDEFDEAAIEEVAGDDGVAEDGVVDAGDDAGAFGDALGVWLLRTGRRRGGRGGRWGWRGGRSAWGKYTGNDE